MPFLDWINKNEAIQVAKNVPYHLIKKEKKYGEETENLLIQGDNLLALKALKPFFANKIKCVFIDPPYNTQSAFTHYDDKLEHSQWLSMMYPRVVLLRELLAENGSIWVSLDDNEAHYFKVLMDEIFGRANFVANVVWEKSDSPKMDSHFFSSRHDHILVYSKSIENFSLKRLQQETQEHYNRVDEGGRHYYTKPLRAMGGQGDSRESRPNLYYGLTAPDGSVIFPVRTDGKDGAWRWSKDKVNEELGRIDWVNGRNGWSPYFRIYADTTTGRPAETIWTHSDVGSNRTSKAEIKALFPDTQAFTTPKPEFLIRRILEIATNEGDFVLDSFLGSGTTAAVAHKMLRKYIGIEFGEHAKTHCIPRLTQVIKGERGGVSDVTNWIEGGGFNFCTLSSPAFLETGLINPEINFRELASFIWHFETNLPSSGDFKNPLLGIYEGTAYYLLYNGILGDRKPSCGNVLTKDVVKAVNEIFPHNGPKVIYGETTRLGSSRLDAEKITFKQIPYDINVI